MDRVFYCCKRFQRGQRGSLLGPRVSMILRRSSEATSESRERFLVLEKASSQKMENSCHATSTSETIQFRQTYIYVSAV